MSIPQLWGDCHTHSNYSDGLYGIAEQTPHFEAFGNDFRLQTDLTGHRYIRIEIDAWDNADSTKRESLLGNPIYLQQEPS